MKMARYKDRIGLLLVITVVAVYISTCVPMPTSLLHSSHAVTAFFSHSAHSLGPVLMASLWRHQLAPESDLFASGTDRINRLCSRIC